MEEAEICTELHDTLDKGSVEQRKKIASRKDIPDECACDVFLKLTEDPSAQVREKTAKNQDIPQNCICRVTGRLLWDKKDKIRRTIKDDNETAVKQCRTDKPNSFETDNWKDLDAKKATVDCTESTCDLPDRIIGEMEANDVDVISVKNAKEEDIEELEEKGFTYSPEKVLWYKYTPESTERYLKEIKKGKYIKKNLKKLKEKNIEFIYDEQLKNQELLDKWYNLYKDMIAKKERGKMRVGKDKLNRNNFTGLYMVEDGKVLAGIMLQEGKQSNQGRYNSAAYGAFSRKYPGISDVMYYKLIERAIDKDKYCTTLGIDTNFYGYHLSNGLYKFKNSVGFTPRPYRLRNRFHHLKVLNPDKFGNPYCFIETDKKKKKAINNVFLRDDKRIRMENYHAQDGMKIYQDGEMKKRTYFKPKHKDFFPDILERTKDVLDL